MLIFLIRLILLILNDAAYSILIDIDSFLSSVSFCLVIRSQLLHSPHAAFYVIEDGHMKAEQTAESDATSLRLWLTHLVQTDGKRVIRVANLQRLHQT